MEQNKKDAIKKEREKEGKKWIMERKKEGTEKRRKKKEIKERNKV